VTAVSAADTQIVNGPNGQLVAVYIESLSSGDETNIRLEVMGAPDLPETTQTTNTATLFYKESVADQASLDFTVGAGSVPVFAPTAEAETTPALSAAASTGTPEPLPTATPASTEAMEPAVSPEPTEESEGGEEFVPPGGLPTTGDNFVPPGFLPTTGEIILPPSNTKFLLPLSVFGLAALAIVGHYLYSRRRRKK